MQRTAAPHKLTDFRLWNTCASLGALMLACPILQAQEKAVPIFKDGQAQVVEAFKDEATWIQHDLWVETEFDSDGDGRLDRMHVDVTRPAQTDSEGLKLPVIFESSPYFCGVGSTDPQYMWDPHQELGGMPPFRENPPPIKQQARKVPMSRSLLRNWVPRGFAVVHSSGPGTGLSQGCPTVGAENEALAPKAVIDWLNGRAPGFTTADGNQPVLATWCTGKVGMTGTSYNGMLPIICATTGVEGLAAIIPISAPTSFYNYYRSNGLVRHPGGYMGEDVDVLYDFIHSGDTNMREHCNSVIRDEVMLDGFDRSNGDYNDFWAERDYTNQLSAYHTPTFFAHGLNDWNVTPSHSLGMFASLKQKGVPTRVFLHQGAHGGPPPLEEMNRWFTRYLFDQENGVEEDPLLLVMREGVKRSEGPTAYSDYPNPLAEDIQFVLGAGGNATGMLSALSQPVEAVESLLDDVNQTGAQLASASESTHRLLYATRELEADLHLSGTPRVSLEMSFGQSAANLSVWLVSLPWTPDGKINDNLISRGWADPQNHDSLRKGEELRPGETYSISFGLEPDDQIIPAGQRIGLMVFSSDRDFTLWPKPGAKLNLHLLRSTLRLPVVGGKAALLAALPAER